MFILVIDTSPLPKKPVTVSAPSDTVTIPHSFVALYKDTLLLGHRTFPPKDQVQSLIPSIHNLLTESLITLSDLSLIKVCIGPGSFTGTRVGVITAKGLAYGAGIPIVGFQAGTGLITNTLEVQY